MAARQLAAGKEEAAMGFITSLHDHGVRKKQSHH